MRRFSQGVSAVALGCATRTFAKKSPTMGPITIEGSFVTKDITVAHNFNLGGLYARSLFAIGEIGHGREVINAPCRLMYIGDEPLREQCVILAREIFSQLVTKGALKPFIEHRVLTMMPGGKGFFFRERDAEAFAESVPMGMEYISRHEYTLFDLQKLPMIVWFNRFDVEYNGRNGICLFPEVSYLNHSCEPNCEVEIRRNIDGEYRAIVRATKPIKKGEELLIHYLPNNNLPLTRFQKVIRDRWAMECTCAMCRSRTVNAMIMCIFVVIIPFMFVVRAYMAQRTTERRRSMAATGTV